MGTPWGTTVQEREPESRFEGSVRTSAVGSETRTVSLRMALESWEAATELARVVAPVRALLFSYHWTLRAWVVGASGATENSVGVALGMMTRLVAGRAALMGVSRA